MSELPNFDENVSFVVDDGASTGPIAMNEIVASVREGERAPSVLIWWAGATDWTRFDSHPDLLASASEPALTDEAAEPVESSTSDDVDTSDDEEVEPAPYVFEPAALTPIKPVQSEPKVDSEPEAPAVELGSEAFGRNAYSASFEPETAQPEAKPAAAISGLFSAAARSEIGAVTPPVPSPDALDATVGARSALDSVGARIEALSSATRRSLTPEQIQHGVDDATDLVPPSIDNEEAQTEQSDAPPADAPASNWTAVEADITIPAPSGRTELSARFEEMVTKSAEHQRRIEWITRVDELLLSACIMAITDSGYVAKDLNSKNSDHSVLFDCSDDSGYVRLELSPLENSAYLGRHVTLGLARGKTVSNPDEAFAIVRSDANDGSPSHGVLITKAEVHAGSVSTQVDLILAADDFVKNDYSVDRDALDSAIAAVLHALEAHWHTMFDGVA